MGFMTIGSLLLTAVVAAASVTATTTVTASSTAEVTAATPRAAAATTVITARATAVPALVGGQLARSAATAASPTAPLAASRWAWPLEPTPSVERRFDPPDQPWLPGHRGVDLAAVSGQSVHAPAAGTVTFAGSLAGRGVLVVAHDGGLRSTFEPVDGAVAVGARVARGQVVGVVTSTPGHCAPDVCLHWGVRRGETYLDPLAFVGRARVVLLPL